VATTAQICAVNDTVDATISVLKAHGIFVTDICDGECDGETTTTAHIALPIEADVSLLASVAKELPEGAEVTFPKPKGRHFLDIRKGTHFHLTNVGGKAHIVCK
jgi:hypothetical protein